MLIDPDAVERPTTAVLFSSKNLFPRNEGNLHAYNCNVEIVPKLVPPPPSDGEYC